MKHTTIASTLFLLASVLCSNSFAGGGMEGGGGVGVRCGGKLELLDLHEARLNGLTPISIPSTDKEAIEVVATKMATHFNWFTNYGDWEGHYRESIVRPMFEGRPFFYSIIDNEMVEGTVEYTSSLPLSKDIGSFKIQPGCSLEQIAYFTDGKSPRLEVVKKSWNELDRLSKVLLIAHETFYVFDRRESLRSLLNLPSDKSSEWTRAFVGELFSTKSVPPLMAGIAPNPAPKLECISTSEPDPYTRGVATQNSKGFFFVFKFLLGANDLYQVRAEFPGQNFAEFIANKKVLTADLKYNGNSTPTQLVVQLTGSPEGHGDWPAREGFKYQVFKKSGAGVTKISEPYKLRCLEYGPS